jgi:DNA ligase 1
MRRRSLLLTLLFSPWTFAKRTPDVLLAKNYTPTVDVSQYLISEKLDGVRALWDGKTLRFRSGQPISAPAWFLAQLPVTPLDGELWLGRGKFDLLSGIVRKLQPVDSQWQDVQYMVFELPAGGATFAQRSHALQVLVQKLNGPQLKWVEQFRLASEKALQTKLKEITAAGGEGLMLHKADAPVITGRSPVLLKLKTVSDAEGIVTAHLPGKGQFAGLLGALQVQTEDGHSITIGSGLSDAQRKSPPPIGSTITYSYRDKTPRGKPRFVSFMRLHHSI